MTDMMQDICRAGTIGGTGMSDMTSAVAIETLRANYPDACYEQLREAVDAAIEALKAQDAAGDTISRRAALNSPVTMVSEGLDWIPAYHIKELPPAQPENDWIPVTKKAHPDLPIRVQAQMDNGWIITAYYQEGEWFSVPDCGEPLKDEYIEAWRELPEPYAERRTDDGE